MKINAKALLVTKKIVDFPWLLIFSLKSLFIFFSA